MKKAWILTTWLALCGIPGYMQLRLNSLFSDHAVLQQRTLIPVWGTGTTGETVTVSMAGQVKTTRISAGEWKVWLDAMAAGNTSHTMTVTSGKQTLIVRDIMIGEVWLCSGQSNMAFPLRAIKPLKGSAPLEEVMAEARNEKLIRQFTIPLTKSTDIPNMLEDVKGQWLQASSSAGQFSAVGYFFARELRRKLNVPVAIVNSSYGGTAIENWMSKDTLDKLMSAKDIYPNFYKQMGQYPQLLRKYVEQETQLLEAFLTDSMRAAAAGSPIPRKPSAPMHPAERGGPGGLWNSMIHPLIPFPVKGCVWYQGEANATRGLQYRDLLPALIGSWRTAWGLPMPFIVIQLPGWKNHTPELREAQWMATQRMPDVSVVAITDCDDTLDVHPGNKEPVGVRAALQAKALVYREKGLTYSGPEWRSMKIKGGKLLLTFHHTGRGLESRNGLLQDFEIAGEDLKFKPAEARIIGKNQVELSHPVIKKPRHARLGWRLAPQINLFNQEGLCALPFRTLID